MPTLPKSEDKEARQPQPDLGAGSRRRRPARPDLGRLVARRLVPQRPERRRRLAVGGGPVEPARPRQVVRRRHRRHRAAHALHRSAQLQPPGRSRSRAAASGAARMPAPAGPAAPRACSPNTCRPTGARTPRSRTRTASCSAGDKPDHFWCQHHNGIFFSTNDLESWQFAGPRFGFGVAVHPKEPAKAWFVPAIKDELRVPPGRPFRRRPAPATAGRRSRRCRTACRPGSATTSSCATPSTSMRPATRWRSAPPPATST